MSGSTLIEVADAVVAGLNAGEFSQEFEATRKPFVRTDLKDLAELDVAVIPVAERVSIFDRSSDEHEYDVSIAVRKRLTSVTNAATDPLAKLTDEFKQHFRRKIFAEPDVRFTGAEVQPYSPEHLEKQNAFFAVVKLTFAGLR